MVHKSDDLPRLILNIDDIRAFHAPLEKFIMAQPSYAIPMIKDRLNAVLQEMQTHKVGLQVSTDAFPDRKLVYSVNFKGSFGRNHITPRGLKAKYIGSLVKV
jgi:DNA replication licensing factor MCM3